jgi:hypothetical protein
MSLLSALERGASPLDQLRSAGFRLFRNSPLVSSLAYRREQRLAFIVGLHALVACGLALAFPVHLFVLGPVLFGVIHVAADVRYLVLRQGLARSWRTVVACGCAALIALRVAEEAHLLRQPARLEFVLSTALALVAVAAAVAARGSAGRAVFAFCALLGLGVAAITWPEPARLVLLHAHNLLAVALLPLVFPARASRLFVPLLLILALGVALASGVGYQLTLHSSGVHAFHRHVLEVADWVAPGLRADRAIGVTSAYVFLQSVHYAVWLIVIPQRSQRGEGSLTFVMSARSLLKDFGTFGVLAIALLALGVVGFALFDVQRAQRTYLSLGMFHAYLEISMLAYLWVRGERARLCTVENQAATAQARLLPRRSAGSVA